MNFSPDDTGVANGNYFGFPFTPEQSELVLLSAPWDVTVSYGAGTAQGPQAIIDASIQVEIYDQHAPDQWQRGIGTIPVDHTIETSSERYRATACQIIDHIEQGGDICDKQPQLDKVNEASRWLNDTIGEQAARQLDANRIVGLVGGDHSTPYGLIRELAQRHDSFGILHIDAHCDLRDAYEGFEHSHASIMFNSLKLPQVSRLTQVAVRDFSKTELDFAQSEPRVTQFTDFRLKEAEFAGTLWNEQCQQIVATLPQKVYVSFDIDGLMPDLCPSTGTPVPGGLDYNRAVQLLVTLSRSGRTIIGFDLTEVSSSADPENEWDANVGARILYKLCNLTLSTHPKK